MGVVILIRTVCVSSQRIMGDWRFYGNPSQLSEKDSGRHLVKNVLMVYLVEMEFPCIGFTGFGDHPFVEKL